MTDELKPAPAPKKKTTSKHDVKPQDPTCIDCRFFKTEAQGPGRRGFSSGECRRYPKVERNQATYWCGEYKAR